MKNTTLENIGIGFLTAITIAVLLFFAPILGFLAGWFAGWVLHLITGSYITNGLNLLFGTTRFQGSNLPMICGTLAALGSYFKSNQTNKNKS